jgi:hypothetical protein
MEYPRGNLGGFIMTNIQKLTSATDPDAAYVLGKIAEAEKEDVDAQGHEEHAEAARKCAQISRIQAGRRLIEVRARMLNKPGQKRCPGFSQWIETNKIPQSTAQRLMTLAGFTEEQRDDAKAKERDRKRAEREAAKAEKPFHMRWLAAMAQFSGLNMQFGGSQKRTLDKAFGKDVAKLEFHSEAEARDFAAQGALAFAEPLPRETLNKTEEKLVARAIRQEIAKIRKEAAQALKEEVDRRMVPILADYGKWLDEARAEKEHYEAAAKLLPDWMSYDDYQVVISCLHPDRAPAGMEEKYRKAFQIMNALKKRFK